VIPTFPNSIVFDDLAERLQKIPSPILFAGAGVSADAEYPRWEKLLSDLDEEVQSGKLVTPASGTASGARMSPKYIPHISKIDDYLWRAEEYRTLMGDSFQTWVAGRFTTNPDRTGNLARELVNLPFSHILTTNYDTVLETAYYEQHNKELKVVHWEKRDQVRSFFRALERGTSDNYIVHLHGTCKDPSSIVLTDSDYVRRYVLSDESSPKLMALIMMRAMVIVGFSLDDPQFNHLFRIVNAQLGPGDARHFMIVPSSDPAVTSVDDHEPGFLSPSVGDILQTRMLTAKYGIQPIFYDPARCHADLLETIRMLQKRLQEKGWQPDYAALSAAALARAASATVPATSRANNAPATAAFAPTLPDLTAQIIATLTGEAGVADCNVNLPDVGSRYTHKLRNLVSAFHELHKEDLDPTTFHGLVESLSNRELFQQIAFGTPASPNSPQVQTVEPTIDLAGLTGETEINIPDLAIEPNLDNSEISAPLSTLATKSKRRSTPGSDDPRKGNFGGQSETDVYRLTGKVSRTGDPDWFKVVLAVTRKDGNPVAGSANFYLHPTFPNAKRPGSLLNGNIVLELTSWGAFTVGVVMEDGTELELDLAADASAPAKFRAR
jgi:hypothetical protein